jgi:hypothetical protein
MCCKVGIAVTMRNGSGTCSSVPLITRTSTLFLGLHLRRLRRPEAPAANGTETVVACRARAQPRRRA